MPTQFRYSQKQKTVKWLKLLPIRQKNQINQLKAKKEIIPIDFIDICVLLESTVPLGPFSLPSLYFLF